MTPPTGTVTFLFTDIEGSTRRWDANRTAMAEAVERHDALVRAAIEGAGGYVFKTLGDAFCAAFTDPSAAMAAAAAAQRAVADADWEAVGGLRIRAAVHAGAADERDGDYFGPPLNRAARLMGAAHGGQTVISLSVRELLGDDLPAGATLRDLGQHRLRDLGRREHVFQLVVPGLPADFPPLASLEQHPHNLPVEAASFIGREREIEELLDHLTQARLLTLTGIGGTGKTRLSLQLAAAALGSYPDGAWFVELSPITTPELVAQTVAAALGVREAPGRPMVDALVEHLAPRRLLLVVDNCEHVIAAVAQLVETVIRRCPNVRVVATSREALAIAGERVYPVAPLGLPEPGDDDPASIAAAEVVRLFAERAQAVRPDFRVTAGNATAVAEICRRLDGIPLAIELAAARTRLMAPAQILERLDQRFQLLTGGSRTAEPRQQTLRAAIAWSYDLLPPEEQAMLQRLSVFRGGWTIEAAAEVCADVVEDEWMATDLLTHLVDKSLVTAAEMDGGMRFGLLETVRAFAHEAASAAGPIDARSEGDAAGARGSAAPADDVRFGLQESVRAFAQEAAEAAGVLDSARMRHGAHFGTRARTLADAFWNGDQATAVAGFELEVDNLRAALEYGMADGAAVALRLCGVLYIHWEVRGYLSEGRRWIEGALAAASGTADAVDLGWAMFGLAVMRMRQGDLAAAQRAVAGSFSALKDTVGPAAIRHVHNMSGNIALASGDLAAARSHYEDAIAASALAGDGLDRSSLVAVHNNLGLVALTQGDIAAAKASFVSALQHAGPASIFVIAVLQFNLALATLQEGDIAATADGLAASLTARHRLGDRWGTSLCVEAFGWVAAAGGSLARAARLMAAAAAMRAELGMPLEPLQQRFHDEAAARVEAALGAEARVVAEAEGAGLGWEGAVGAALEGHRISGDSALPT